MIQLARALVAFLILTCFGSAGWAGALGPEFQVNTYTTHSQRVSSVAELLDGGFVVTWASDGQDGAGHGVYGQRYDGVGNPVGIEFRVNKYTPSTETLPSVAGLADGGFVVLWTAFGQDGSSYGIYGQRYNAASARVGTREFRVNKYTASNQFLPSVAGIAGGGFVVTWQSNGQDGDGWGVYSQRYDVAGKRTGKREFPVNNTVAANQQNSSVAGLGGGGFIVAWQSYGQDGDGEGLYGQRYDISGKRVGKREFQINKATTSDQSRPRVADLADGGFVVAWESYAQDGHKYGVYGQRYNAAGKRAGKREFMVNKTTAEDQNLPSVAGLADGGFVVTWQSESQYGLIFDIYGQRYNAAGNRVAKREFLVNTYTTAFQGDPDAAGLTDGGFVINWESDGQDGSLWGIYGQRFAP